MQSHSQRSRTTSLPPEVWICIFHHATDVPGTLIPDTYSNSTFFGPVYTEEYHKEIREALITKRALVCVCRQWWYLAIPFLYRSIYIRRARSLPQLSLSLAAYAAGKGAMTYTRPVGEYTQRLDMAICDLSEDAVAGSRSLITIMKHMTHLAIAVFAPSTWYSCCKDVVDNIIDALVHSASSLRVLDWDVVPAEPCDHQFMDLLAKCTQLRILHYPDLIWSKKLGYDSIPAPVTTLRLTCAPTDRPFGYFLQPFELNIAQRFKFPALRELILDIYPSITSWVDLLRECGSQLVSVHFCTLRVEIGRAMELLAETSPALQRLTITSDFYFESFDPHFVFPSVTYLGLFTLWFRSIDHKFERFFAVLDQLRSRMPSLRVIQLLYEDTVQRLLNSHTELAVRLLQPFMVDASFRIEDRDGVLLTDRLRALGNLRD